MANLNIRNFPEELLVGLNHEAERDGRTLRSLVIQKLGGKVLAPPPVEVATLTAAEIVERGRERMLEGVDLTGPVRKKKAAPPKVEVPEAVKEVVSESWPIGIREEYLEKQAIPRVPGSALPRCPKCQRTGPVIEVQGGAYRCTRCNVVVE